MVACLDEFAAEGVDLAAYNSDENADDIDALRQALGYDKIIYYGESYGTLLGQYLLRRHPDILARDHAGRHRAGDGKAVTA